MKPVLRISAFDNLKLAMIFLVVFGHLIEPFITGSALIKTLYMSIYSFHMPVFIMVAGALTKSDLSENRIFKNINSLFIPFLTFTVLYEILNFIGHKTISEYTLNWRPFWILWFFLSMFIWKHTVPVIMQFRFPLILSIIVSLGAGYVSDVGYFLGISRTIYFFPFFVFGYMAGSQIKENKILIKIPKPVFIAFLLLNPAVFWVLKELPVEWLYGSFSYERLGSLEWHALFIRSMVYLISFTSSIAIVMLAPNRKSEHSIRGRNSLYVYVWHGFIVKIAVYYEFTQLFKGSSNALILFTIFAVSLLITVLLSGATIANLTEKWLLNPVRRLVLLKPVL